MPPLTKIKKGQRFKDSKLTALRQITSNIWECKCDCGGKIIRMGYIFSAGHVKSCGCLSKVKTRKSSICWDCMRSYGKISNQCCWAREFRPVDGWVAEPTIIYGNGKDIESFIVYDCPEFISDSQNKAGKQIRLC